MTNVIETRGLGKRFGNIDAVQTLDLDVREGEMFGLVGPDGAGKTTAIRLLCGILTPSSGTARVLGSDIVKEADQVKRQIGYLSQRFSLYGDLSIDENIEFFAEINNVFDYRGRREELLDFTRLTPFRERLAERLSGGMKQKLALACTLIHTPKLIFLDEPTTGVDPVSRRDFWKILQSLLKQGITIVMSTPYLDEAERCTRVGLMNAGSLMIVDTPEAVKRRMQGEVVEMVGPSVRAAQGILKPLPEVLEVQTFGDRLNVVVRRVTDVPALLGILEANSLAMESWRVVPPSLENVFISLLTHNKQE